MDTDFKITLADIDGELAVQLYGKSSPIMIYTKEDFKRDVKQFLRTDIEIHDQYKSDDKYEYLFKPNIICSPVCLIFNKSTGKSSSAYAETYQTRDRNELEKFLKDIRKPIYVVMSYEITPCDQTTFIPTEEPPHTKYIVRYYPKIKLSWIKSKLQFPLSKFNLPYFMRSWLYRWYCTIK